MHSRFFIVFFALCIGCSVVIGGAVYWQLHHVSPVTEIPDASPTTSPTTAPSPSSSPDLEGELGIEVTAPQAGQKITSPLKITGQARGNWFFEASFPVKLVDESGNKVAQGTAQAQGEWMTEDFVPFSAELEFSSPESLNGILILENDNPSGLPEFAKRLEVSVQF